MSQKPIELAAESIEYPGLLILSNSNNNAQSNFVFSHYLHEHRVK